MSGPEGEKTPAWLENELRTNYPRAIIDIRTFNTINLRQAGSLVLDEDNLKPPFDIVAAHPLVEANNYFQVFTHILTLPKSDDLQRVQATVAEEIEFIFGHASNIFGEGSRLTVAQQLKLAIAYPNLLKAYNAYKEVNDDENKRWPAEAPSPVQIEALSKFPLVRKPSVQRIGEINRLEALLSSPSLTDFPDQYKDTSTGQNDARITGAPTVRVLGRRMTHPPTPDEYEGLPTISDVQERFFQEERATEFKALRDLIKEGFRMTQFPLLVEDENYKELIRAFVGYGDTHPEI